MRYQILSNDGKPGGVILADNEVFMEAHYKGRYELIPEAPVATVDPPPTIEDRLAAIEEKLSKLTSIETKIDALKTAAEVPK